MGQSRNRPTDSDHGASLAFFFFFFFGASLALGSALELLFSPATELVVASCHIKFTFCLRSQFDGEMVHCCCTE